MIYSSLVVWKGIRFYLSADDNAVIGIVFNEPQNAVWQDNMILLQCKSELQEYLAGKRQVFDVPIRFNGTDFQNSVWKQLLEIPYGQVISYGELAKAIGQPKAARAVGGACNKNPIGIIIPCHRVVGKNGSLTGYAGGIGTKEKLLALEKKCLK